MKTNRNSVCGVLAAIVLVSAAPHQAFGFEELPYVCDDDNSPRWVSNPEYALDARPFATAAELMSFFMATAETFDGLNGVEGTTARANLANPNFTLDPTMSPFDLDGTIAGDFTSEVMLGYLLDIAVGFGPVVWDAAACEILAGSVVLTDQAGLLSGLSPYFWAWDTPAGYGDPYWNANQCPGDLHQMDAPCSQDPAFGRYARPVILHEVMHNFGLGHIADSYGYMNYNIHPWLNAPEPERIEPLGDDRQGLRALYPAGSDQSDVAVLNTWYDPDDTQNDAAKQFRLCKPSRGSLWADRFATFCGRADPSDFELVLRPLGEYTPEICPGDLLRTRYATTNLGTTDMDFTEELWFSVDEDLSGGDLPSPDSFDSSLCDGCSGLRSRVYQSPEDLPYGTEFFVLANLDPDSTDEDTQNNAIPLRGKVRTKFFWECNFDHIEIIPF